MKIEDMKDAYESYNVEDSKRKELIEAIFNNRDIITLKNDYAELYNKTNKEIYPILGNTSYEELHNYVAQTMLNPEYKDLMNFFLILNGYNQLKNNYSNAQKFSEVKHLLYFDLINWYLPLHGVSSDNKKEIISEFTETTADSIGIRNLLADKEELNNVFDNIVLAGDFERTLAVDSFVSEVDLILTLISLYIVKNSLLQLPNAVPTSLILRLVLMNILTKKYQLGFRIEEYMTRYFENNEGIKKIFDGEFKSSKRVLNDYIEEVVLEVNDITNEYINYKEKRKAL